MAVLSPATTTGGGGLTAHFKVQAVVPAPSAQPTSWWACLCVGAAAGAAVAFGVIALDRHWQHKQRRAELAPEQVSSPPGSSCRDSAAEVGPECKPAAEASVGARSSSQAVHLASCKASIEEDESIASILEEFTSDTTTASQEVEVPFSLAMLPSELHHWFVDPSTFTYICRSNGQPWQLGSGAFGRVYKAEYHGEVIAAKEVPLDRGVSVKRAFVMEAMRLHSLRHPHVVGFCGVSIVERDGQSFGVILMEYAEGRDLYTVLPLQMIGGMPQMGPSTPGQQPGLTPLPSFVGVHTQTSVGRSINMSANLGGDRFFSWYRKGRLVAYDICKGLNYLHSRRVVHLDLKSSNVLLTLHGAAKLADVGFARTQHKSHISLNNLVGTFAWAAPEILMGGSCTQAVDIYSFGVVLWEICTGERPERGKLRAVAVPEECPQAVADMIHRCLAIDPEARPAAHELLQELATLARNTPARHSVQLERPSPFVSPEAAAAAPRPLSAPDSSAI